jgi:nitrate/nitrite transporter NarK
MNVVVNGNGNESPPLMSLLKIRTLFLLFYGTLGSCLPYFPVYYRAIGLDPDFIGLLGSITPAITFVVSPLWGALADSTGAYRGIMLLTFVLSVIGRCVSIHSVFKNNVLFMGLLVAVTAVLNAPVKVASSFFAYLRQPIPISLTPTIPSLSRSP